VRWSEQQMEGDERCISFDHHPKQLDLAFYFSTHFFSKIISLKTISVFLECKGTIFSYP
mgnify:CR=1